VVPYKILVDHFKSHKVPPLHSSGIKIFAVIDFFYNFDHHLILKIMQVTSILFVICLFIVGIFSSTYLLHIRNNFFWIRQIIKGV
jgi:hypothetical protein